MLSFKLVIVINILCAILLIFSNNLISSLMGFLGIIFGSSILVLMHQVEFLVFSILLVYNGAVAVVFFYVLLLFKEGKDYTQEMPYLEAVRFAQIVLFFVFVKVISYFYYFNKVLSCVLHANLDYISYIPTYFECTELASWVYFVGDAFIFISLFSPTFSIYMILQGFLILFAMVGSIALCLQKVRNTTLS